MNYSNANKLYVVGKIFEFIDFKESIKYYLMASCKGNPNAMFNLGNYFCSYGKGKVSDHWIEDFISIEDAEDSRKYGNNSISEIFKKAVKYYWMAIEKGHIDAIYYLADFYRYKNIDYEAHKYYLMAIDKGHSGAMYVLGKYYEEIEENFSMATNYYLMAIEKGNSQAMFAMGSYFNNMNEYTEAKKYYKMAIKKGNIDAMLNLASIYMNEDENYIQAKKYYKMAVEKGNIDAMRELAFLYMDEDENYTKAKKYFLMVIKQGELFDVKNYLEISDESDIKDLEYMYTHNLYSNGKDYSDLVRKIKNIYTENQYLINKSVFYDILQTEYIEIIKNFNYMDMKIKNYFRTISKDINYDFNNKLSNVTILFNE